MSNSPNEKMVETLGCYITIIVFIVATAILIMNGHHW